MQRHHSIRSCQVNTLFQKNLPTYPYATNNFKDGLYRRNKTNAAKYKYIQFNKTNSLEIMNIDLDREVYYEDLEPKPNLIVMNRDNSKCHAMYAIKPGVHLNTFSSRKPIAFAENVLNGLTMRLNGDRNYSHLIAKNPLNESFRLYTPRIEPYDLNELAEWIPDKIIKATPKAEHGAYGRNCEVFDKCRHWAYIAIRQYIATSFAAFHSAVLSRCIELNTTVYLPMTQREVKTIARSISKWVWDNKSKLTSFSKQAHRSKLGNKAKSLKAEQNRKLALVMLGKGFKINEIADSLGLSRRTIFNYIGMSI